MQADTTTLSDLIERLRTVGEKPPRKLFDDILEHGQEAVTPLIEIVTDYPGDDPDADGQLYWATYHAIRLLGELRAADAIGPILDLLDEDDDYVDMYLPKSLAQIGQPAVEPLRAALVAPDADVYGVARAARALTEMAELYPERRSEIVGMLTERLDADIPNEDGYALRAFLISNLADLRAVEATPSVQRAFQEDLVDEMVIDLETYRLIAERPEGTTPGQALWPTTAKLDAQFAPSAIAPGALPGATDLAPVSRRAQPFGRKVGRNEACPCGSTKKYKRCHGR